MTHGGASYLALVASWSAMLAVMMLPTTWPWLRALRRLSAREGAGAAGLDARVAPSFGAGYLVVWLAFSFAAAGLQVLLARVAYHGPALAGGALVAAGLYQLTPLKSACLEHCRSPWSVLLARWPIGARGAFALGASHGVFCLGCCWALMLLGLATGWGGWTWMAALTGLVAAEKLTTPGPRLARWTGVGLLGVGVAYWLRM